MAFRTQARTGAFLMVAATAALAQTAGLTTFEVKHHHLRGAGAGTLTIAETGISFTEPKKMGHSRSWLWENIQQATLERGALTILTYEDAKSELWRDREFAFTGLPPNSSGPLTPFLRRHLGGRLIVASSDITTAIPGEWVLPAKLLHARRGAEGVLRFSPGLIAFDTERGGEPRLWSYDDIETVTHPSPTELSLTVRERNGLRRLPTREFRFELKEPMPEARYQALWRDMNRLRIGVAPPSSATGTVFTMPGHTEPSSKEKK
jgi:hypothetical protein